MTTPQDIIRAWCASCGMAEPSNGDCGALLSKLFPALSVAQALGEVAPMDRSQSPADFAAWLLGSHSHSFINQANMAEFLRDYISECSQPAFTADAELLVSAYRLAATLQGEQSLVVMELANRFARLAGKSAEKSELLTALQAVYEACDGYVPNTSKSVWAAAYRAIAKETGDAQ